MVSTKQIALIDGILSKKETKQSQYNQRQYVSLIAV